MQPPTHYERLGVAPDASPGEIRAAYRRLARTHHPDAGGGAHGEMAAVNEAWRVLSDPARRAAYDASLRPAARFQVGGAGEVVDAGEHDPDWISPAEARAAHRFGVTLVAAMILAAAVLVPLFVYAFMRSASLSP